MEPLLAQFFEQIRDKVLCIGQDSGLSWDTIILEVTADGNSHSSGDAQKRFHVTRLLDRARKDSTAGVAAEKR